MKRFKPGVSFGDFVVHEMAVRKSRLPKEQERDYRRGWLLWLAVVMALGMILVRLVQLQIIYGSRYRILADENRIKQIVLPAPRGVITDRNSKVLAQNRKVMVKDENTGLEVEAWQREYPGGEAAEPVTGYVGEVSQEEVGLLKEEGKKYLAGSYIGRGGVEISYEEILRGIDGGRLVEVNNLGQAEREMGRKEAVAGQELKLTLDLDLQTEAYAAFAPGTKGAAVISRPRTGEVLGLVSVPAFDPNSVSEMYAELAGDPRLPLFNRGIGGVYPPGSTFKLITTAAAIGEGKVRPDFTFTDTGVIRVGEYAYSNWFFSKNGGVEGTLGFARAITRSTDTFFYKVGEMTTPQLISKWARLLGLGEKTGIDLPGEAEGLIGDPEWKEKVRGEKWYLGNTYHMAIGQGDMLVTPVQINLMTNVFAAGGKKCRLHLYGEEQCSQTAVTPEVLEIVEKGMSGACSPGGTSFVMFDWNEAAGKDLSRSAFAGSMTGAALPMIACKTGTAEYVAENGKVKTHGWLTAFAPADNPEISVTVVVEGGGEGSNVAAPIVRKIMAKYFSVEDRYPYGSIKSGLGE